MTDESYSRRWAAPSTQNQLAATLSLPGSKSLSNRELVLSALAASPTTLRDTLVSRDSTLMIEALRKLGTQIEVSGTTVVFTPKPLLGPAAIDCGLAGTVMRFVPALASLANGQIDFDGDLAARKRPMKTTIDSLRYLGVVVNGESLPFSIQGQGEVGAKFKNGLTVSHVGNHLPSMPHIEMTIDCLRKRGVDASQTGPASWRVEPGEISGGEVRIEPDLSNAGPFLAAAMVAGGSVTISNWPKKTTQVGNDFDGILQQMGASVERIGNDLVVSGTGMIQGVDIDLSTGGELTPVIAALAALAKSPSQIRGVAHLRGHETDRLKALVSEINSLGGDATETEDGMIIRPAKLHGGTWITYEDHRMATAGAIIGLAVPGVEIEDISVTAKTIPEFVSLWEQMLKGST
ncbi:MAG: 3-phosphoshikimate 1-carboxyvinyltransferase [Micrococcales bacterium]|nr:3-phosphoshikimate 1-carboxyvinyltransferase [Micrococcales bacterium]